MAGSMEVEGGGSLKRCSSAPLINGQRQDGTPHPDRPPTTMPFGRNARARRFSASFAPHSPHAPHLSHAPRSPHSPHSPGSSAPRLTPRVSQLRQEECADITNVREVAHERETHSAMQMSQSWEDLLQMTGASNGIGAPMSPTQAARFSPGVSPSPTRKAFATRRSLSPIAMRPSCLSPAGRPSGLIPMKRRFDLEEAPNAKRCCWSTDRLTPSTPGTPDSTGDSSSGFTFRPVSPRAPSLSSPLPSAQTRTSQSPS